MTKLRTFLQLSKWLFMLCLNTGIIFQNINHISKHYTGIMPISDDLNASNIFEALNKYLQEMNLSLSDCTFYCKDTTNINSGMQSGLIRLLKHAVPLGNWVGCGNHKVPLCFKHLLNEKSL